jgi:hypothetical protein
MACVNEFGIIEQFETDKNYGDEYEPKKYNCIAVDDDFVNAIIKLLSIMKSYWHCFSRLEFGLDHWGITLIPPESMDLFYEVIVKSKYFKKSEELAALASLILKAKQDNKFIIHYGV